MDCSCDHLTSFAVLLDTGSGKSSSELSDNDAKALEVISLVGAIMSAIFLAVTILVSLLYERPTSQHEQ